MRANHVAFTSNPEELTFNAIFQVVGTDFLGQDLVERFFQERSMLVPGNCFVFLSIRDPDVVNTGIALLAPYHRGDSPATAQVFLPELPNFGIETRKGVTTARFLVREKRGVKIKFNIMFFCPIDPALKMFRLYCVAINKLPAEIPVSGMQAYSMAPRDKGKDFCQVCFQLFDRACLAGIITGGLDTAR